MDNFENNPVTPAPENTPSVSAEVQALRHLVTSVLLLVLVVSGTMNIYLWRQYRTVQTELSPIQPQAAQILSEANRMNGFASDVARKFLDYAKVHPDFTPILNKYGIRGPGPTSAPPTTLTPPPATKK